MSIIVDSWNGLAARVWYGSIQFLSATITGAAASVDTVARVGDVVVAASQGVAHTARSVVGGDVVGAAGQGVSNTIGRVAEVATTAGHGVAGGAQDLVAVARIVTGIDPVLVPEAMGITEEEWNLMDQTNEAIASLRDWSGHNFPTAPEAFTKDDVDKCLPAARVMAVASALSYAEQEIAAARLTSGQWDVQVIDKNDAQAMIFKAKDKPVMIVAFRGTQLPFDRQVAHSIMPVWTLEIQFIPDWARNFDVLMTPYDREPDGNSHGLHPTLNGHGHPNDKRNLSPQVHEGFWNGWKSLRNDLMGEIKEFHHEKQEEVQLYVTGHSQGAALAGVSLWDLLRDQQTSDTYKIKGCLLLAAPKHGDKDYTKVIGDAVAKWHIPLDLVANYSGIGCDPVVSVPPQVGNFTPYAAPAGRFWIVEETRQTMGPATADKKERVINPPWWELAGRILVNVPRHAIGGRVGYLHAMEN